MARSSDGQPRKRFSKSGHTSHQPRPVPPSGPPPYGAPPPYQGPPPGYQAPAYPPPQYGPPHEAQYGPQYGQQYGPAGYQPPPPTRDGFGSPTYHHVPPGASPAAGPHPAEPRGATTAGGAALLLGRSAISGTNRAARAVTRTVIRASKADGADESGLTALIWNQVLS
ncbi:MAG TPA: hypothetical protein VHC23_06535, partial [Jatrophihabitans sp.]|nr:hypothetical protein [Jatrophihabitans sp.]